MHRLGHSLGFRLYIITFVLMLVSGVAMADENFSNWLDKLRYEAKATGISDNTTEAVIRKIELLPNTIKLDQTQPEFTSPFLEYYQKRVDARKIQKGRELLLVNAALLTKIESQYGVPRTILLALWGMETNYGTQLGKVDILSTLATLAYDGRRSTFFRGQLLDAIRMVELGHVGLNDFFGSWAGAFGNMQFMPTTFMLYAVDSDGDGKVDVANSLPDAFASAANYLSKAGWRHGEPVMVEVQLPNSFDWQDAQLTLKKTTQEWAVQGVRPIAVVDSEVMQSLISKTLRPNNKQTFQKTGKKKETASRVSYQTQQIDNIGNKDIKSLALPNVEGQASILLPQGWQGPAFMVFENFDVLMDWNRSINYALSVAQLAKQLRQEPPILGGQLAEANALSFQQVLDLQNMLKARGFDVGVPDGLPGLKTQAAVRAYQQAQQLPADGYASPSLYQRIISQQ